MKILKFGGGCLKDAELIKKLPKVLKNYNNEKVIVVISAFAKITNLLEQYKFQEVFSFVEIIMDDLDFTSAQKNDVLYSAISPSYFMGYSLRDFISKHDNIKKKHLSYPSRVCIGEYISSKILHSYLIKKDLKSTMLDAALCVNTYSWNNNSNSALFNYSKLPDTSSPYYIHNNYVGYNEGLKHMLIITQGFISRGSSNIKLEIKTSEKNEIRKAELQPLQRTTLGREGSDYSAAIFASMFNASEVILFKDVNGVYSSDPKKNPAAKLFTNLTYKQASNLCSNGNTVIHPETMQILERENIPIRIKNFNNLDLIGTLIN